MGLKKKILALTAAIGLSMFSMKGVASLDLNNTQGVQNYTQQIEQVINDISATESRDGIIVTQKAKLTQEKAKYISETLYEKDKSTSVEDLLKRRYIYLRIFPNSYGTIKTLIEVDLEKEDGEVFDVNLTEKQIKEYVRNQGRRGELEDENRTVSGGSAIANIVRRSIEDVQADILTNSNSISGVETKISNLENQIEQNNQEIKSMLVSLETFFKNSLRKVRNLEIELDRISIANILGRGQSE